MKRHLINQLLASLHLPDKNIRQQATAELWNIWFREKGDLGLELLRRAQVCLEAGQIEQGEEILTNTIVSQPDFAEAWNQRAVLYYTLEQYEQARDDCLQVVSLNPNHFGAWHGLGLCYLALKDFREAIAAFEKALAIQPFAEINQKLILECNLHLS